MRKFSLGWRIVFAVTHEQALSLSVSAWVGGDDILGAEFAGTESNPS